MRVLCLHDSAVRFSGCARNALYATTYLKVKVESAHPHPQQKNPVVGRFPSPISATYESGATSQQRQHRLKGGASRP